MTSHGIKKKTDYEHIRLRPAIYIGSPEPHTQNIVLYREGKPYVTEVTWTPALFTCLREIIDNALDEIIGHGHGNKIEITYDPATMIFSVSDNGRGIPIEFDKVHKQYLATMVLSEPRAGRNFDERENVVGQNGVGASATSITSEWFRFEIVRDGKKFKQMFREGLPGAKEIAIAAPKITPCKTEKTGTKIEFCPSTEVFKSRLLPEEFVRARATEIAICNPLLKIFYNGEQIRVKARPEQTLFPTGKPISIDIREGHFTSRFWITHGNEGAEHVHSLVNNIPVFNGGVHIDAFRRLFYANLLTALERESKRRKLTPNRSDIQDGLLIYNVTTMQAPNFDSQSKSRLINEEVASIMKKGLENPELYREVIRKNPEWIAAIFERCSDRTQKRDAADINKLNKAGKKQKVEKLNDAIGLDRQKCILFLAEGDSAISGLTASRDKMIHGGLPLRGKVLNCHPSKSSLKTIASNEALLQITRSIGLSIGERANRFKLRYGKVFITVDADEDGKDICSLLVNFFYHMWPELFDPANPFIYVFDTPLIIAVKGKERRYWYNDDYHEFDQEKMRGWEITRAKGLAALKQPDWKRALAEPKVTAIVDDGELKEALDLLFNQNRSDDRKKWMGI